MNDGCTRDSDRLQPQARNLAKDRIAQEAQMNTALRKAALSAIALLGLGGMAQAGGIDVVARRDPPSYERPRFADDCRDRRYIRAPDWDDCRVAGSYHRPWRGWRPWGYRHHRVPVAAWPYWRDGDDCRIVVTRRENPWGEVIVKRTKICR